MARYNGNTFTGGNFTVSGVVSGADLSKVGSATLALLAPNTFTGNTTVTGGTLTLSNTNANINSSATTTIGGTSYGGAFVNGALTLNLLGTTATSLVTLNQGSTLTLDNSLVNSSSRLGSTTGITMAGGGNVIFIAMNSAGVATTQTVGTLLLGSGHSTITAGYTAAAAPGATSLLTFASLSRSLGATVNFIGGTGNVTPLGTSTNQIVFTTATSVTSLLQGTGINNGGNGILPFAEVNGGANTGDFASYGQTGTTGIAAFTGYNNQTMVAGAAASSATEATNVVTITTASATVAASPIGATEVGNTVTIITTAAHGFAVGQSVLIGSMANSNYNGTFTITSVTATSVPYTPTTFTYTAACGYQPGRFGRRHRSARPQLRDWPASPRRGRERGRL